jgi:hypothetical protein
MRKILAAIAAVAVLSTLVGVAITTVTPQRASATPVSTDELTYAVNGRVFPDPHGCRNGAPGSSPFAKGNTCAVDFIQYEEMTRGLKFLEETFPDFSKYYTLNKDFQCNGKPSTGDERCSKFRSAGLPVTTDENGDTFVRERRRLHMFRVTDENSSIPLKKREWFVYPLSIHGIERAGVEGGVRAVEDLATWGACEAETAPAYVNCAAEVTGTEDKPYPLLESSPNKSLGTGEALKNAVVVIVMPNPDGWLRGDRFRDRTPGTSFYQRYNGNGVDVNRDWPTGGWTFRPYTPASEPETKAFGKVLRELGPKDQNGDPKWSGGIDLHGQLIDRAFSFTLMGAGEHNYAKNQRILQVVKGAWRDAEARLGYSPIIKPNDAPETDPTCPGCVYGVQWGTVWDTIDYTITGGFGDWINNPIGLNADGIDNEMSLSHLSTCGVGTCFVEDVEQLHVDGNKSLMYAQVNYNLKKEKKNFGTKGRVAYVRNKGFIKARTDRLAPPPRFTKLDPQEDIKNETLSEANEYTYEFNVKGPKQGNYNGGIEVSLTCITSPVNPSCELAEAILERKVKKNEEPPGQGECPDPNDCWETINSYFLQGAGYSATGKALHANLPLPGKWRVRLEAAEGTGFDTDIFFTKEKAWADPGQLGYKVSTMRFWKELEKFANPGLEPLSLGQIQRTNSWKSRYDSIVVTNRVYKQVADELKDWVADKDGNLVLTDKAVGMLNKMKIVDGGVNFQNTYAGYINFETENEDPTYEDPLARNINQPGAAEGGQGETDELDEEENHRHQIYEPVPLGIAIEDANGSDQFNSPVWYVEENALNGAKGEGNAVGTTGEFSNVSLGEIKYKGGRIRWTGALLPDPSEKFDHPFGLNNYALTYSGYQVIQNLLTYER